MQTDTQVSSFNQAVEEWIRRQRTIRTPISDIHVRYSHSIDFGHLIEVNYTLTFPSGEGEPTVYHSNIAYSTDDPLVWTRELFQ